MKNAILISLVLLILITPAFGAGSGNGIHDAGTGLEDSELKEAGQGTGQGLVDGENTNGLVQAKNTVQAQNGEQVRQMIQEHTDEMIQLQEQMKTAEKTANQNQNEVRSAVHALLSMETMAGGIGSQVSAIAKEYDNSFEKTLAAEEKIQSKGSFSRLFFGGDAEAAEELEAQVTQNQNKIQELKQLHEQCPEDCDAETKQLLQEQIQSMENEQTRLGELAQKEKSNKGWFGWMNN
jgi:hypothetical protein